ncbi:response regulator transcription factor [Arthrospira platensis SPKY1]|nr:response regulator transcription factor [Arthrospira platensis SPKY1]
MIKVMVVHPTKLISSLLASVLQQEKDFYVTGQCQDAAAALDRLAVAPCHIVLVAANLPADGALQLTEMIRADYPEIKVLVFGLPKAKRLILQYVMAGASGYILQELPVAKLFEHIRAAHEEKALVSPEITAAFMQKLAEMSRTFAETSLDPAKLNDLTPREMEVLTLIGEGLTNQEISERLVIEVGTVKNHVHNILSKLDAPNRETAAAHLASD